MAETLYKRRVAEGLCGMCGKNPIAEGSVGLCTYHLNLSKIKAAKKRKIRKSKGLCIGCGEAKPLSPGGRCDNCLDDSADSAKKSRAIKKDLKLCVACSKSDPTPAKPGCVLCQKHIDDRSAVTSAHYARRKAAGLCRFGNHPPLPGKSMCAYHTEQRKDYRVKLKMEVMEVYGGCKCAWPGCKNEDLSVLHLHHVNGGGCKHRSDINVEGGYQFYLWIRANDYPDGYSVLCPTHHTMTDNQLRESKKKASNE